MKTPAAVSADSVRRCDRRRPIRRGAILIMMVSLLVALLGMLGLVFDAGMLMSQTRQAQNIADAAALAAARDIMTKKPVATARQTATNFVVQVHGFEAPAASDIRIPPTTGPHAGLPTYVEVVVRHNANTHFIGFLPGMGSVHQVVARAVAGYESYSAGEGVIVLDRRARPGLSVGGNAQLVVNGQVTVNSEGGGLDEFGQPINNGNTGVAISNSSPTGVYAKRIQSVGGSDKPEYLNPYVPGDPHPLKARSLPEPDPLINLPIPTVGNGVDNRSRGSVSVLNNNVTGLSSDSAGQNRVATAGESIAGGLYTAVGGEVILHPGIYSDITINGGSVIMIPGIYVIRSLKNNQTCLATTGGTVKADGILFYITGHNYEPSGGTPDVNDGELLPPVTDGALLGRVTINAGLQMSPIDTSKFDYASLYAGAAVVSDEFDGMLFFQRRRSTETVTIGGNSSAGTLAGTLYAKWASFGITGQGTYNAQFIAGSITCSGQGAVTVQAAADAIRGRAAVVYLVE